MTDWKSKPLELLEKVAREKALRDSLRPTDAYGYVRCSGLGQMVLDGPVRQRDSIFRFAQRLEIKIVDVYEESHTGSDLDGREVFQKMRALMLANGVRTVICEKLDRLARDIIVQESIIADFNKHGIILLSATPGEEDLCSKDPTRVLIRQILGCFFEYERKMMVLKTRSARDRLRAQNGKCEGRKAYGARPGEKRVLDLILRQKQEGYDASAIADYLNDSGLLTRYDKQWNSGTVWKIIRRHNLSTTTPKL